MESIRMLLEGERVEVRQKEVGLRGSWHCGVVVQVKSGRRVVEYDDLFTLDGSKKLRECIPLTEKNNVQFPVPQHSKVSAAEHGVRGFIRPIPPPCLLSAARNWKKGLLVDAFYDYAWWEGILLHDALKKNKASKVKIFFPEEGDELSCYAKDVRVSQEWDEGSRQWVVRGIWPFGGDTGELDIDSLRIISRPWSSLLKKLWHQRNVFAQASSKAKVKSSTALSLEHQGCHVGLGAKLSSNVNGLALLSGGQRFSSACKSEQSTSTGNLRVQEREAANRLEELGTKTKKLKLQANHSGSMNCSLENSRSAAKKFLVDSGWKTFVRTRSQGATQGMKYAVYLAPNGSKYYSLASACRSWRKLNNLSGSLEEGLSQSMKLLDAYSLAEEFLSSGKRFMRHDKTKAGQPGEPCKRKAGGGGKLKIHSGSLVNVKSRKSAKGSSTQTRLSKPLLPAINVTKSKSTVCMEELKKRKFTEEQTERKRSKPMPFADKSKKRKCNEEGTVQKCKKGRPSIRNQVFLQDGKASRGRGGWKMEVLLSSPQRQTDSLSGQNSAEATPVKRSTVLSWLIDRGIIRDNEPVSYLSRKDGHVMKKGELTREGVLCKCCNVVFNLSNFEAHAGSKLHRPSANTFLDDGRSITDCQLQSCALQDPKEDSLASDDTCGVCADGGELILCDHCPSTFHPNCIGLEVVPDGEWYCPRCLCGGCSQNKMAGDGAGTLSRCYQCELGYHSVCAPESLVLKSVNAATSAWFCSHKCEQLFTDLRELVGKANLFGDGFSWKLLRSLKNDLGLAPSSLEVMAEHYVKLGVAHDVMQECFIPMVDPRTKIDLISQALYNRKSKVLRLDYGGFYTLILEKGDEMISVAAIRVHGCRLAEMPLVGTRYQYRRQGMCRRLMQALEQMLGNIGVEKLVLPAVPELLETWTGAFSFQYMSVSELHELSRLSLMTFPGTTFLQKRLEREQSQRVAISQLVLPEKAHSNDSLACKSMGNLLVAAGMPLDACLSENHLSMGCSHRNSHTVEDINCPSHDHVEAFEKPVSLCLECPKSPRTTPDGLCSNSSLEHSNEGEGRKDDDIQYARVVRATTRSKRLVKSSKWVADGLRELAKDIEESSCNLKTGDSMHEAMSEGSNLSVHMLSDSDQEKGTTVLASTNNFTADRTHLYVDATLGPSYTYRNLVDDPLRIFLAEAGFVYSSNYYVRRGRKKQQEGEINPTCYTCEVPSALVQSKVA